MRVTREEIKNYVTRYIGGKDIDTINQIMEMSDKLFFENGDVAETDVELFGKWMFYVFDTEAARLKLYCVQCGFSGYEYEFDTIKEKREAFTKRAVWNEEKKDYEWGNKEYEIEFYICPKCKGKLPKSSEIVE